MDNNSPVNHQIKIKDSGGGTNPSPQRGKEQEMDSRLRGNDIEERGMTEKRRE